MNALKIIGRGSKLSLLQIDKVKGKLSALFPEMPLEVITRSSEGDKQVDIPLHTLEGSDFFTQSIFNALDNGEADIAVHSLKDMSAEHFFGANKFAVVDREDTRDVAIFNKTVITKLHAGEKIIIGTCSPRREQMATVFLAQALPQINGCPQITTQSIRGNVDTRLRKLQEQTYDGIILAVAGLNRLLEDAVGRNLIEGYLADKLWMFLPLVECVPAPCQGAIVVEAHPQNQRAVEILNVLNENELMQDCMEEKKIALHYGSGCLQRFGVTSFRKGTRVYRYAAGVDESGEDFQDWFGLPSAQWQERRWFSSVAHMGKFFGYEYPLVTPLTENPVVYVSNYKVFKSGDNPDWLKTRRVWASGTRTWYDLASRGLWVEGSADAFGLESLQPLWNSPVCNIRRQDVTLLTHEQAADGWIQKGWKAVGTYRLLEKKDPSLCKEIAQCNAFFWTSYHQYQQYKQYVPEDSLHACPSGETSALLEAEGLTPLVFPTIKSFIQWRQSVTR